MTSLRDRMARIGVAALLVLALSSCKKPAPPPEKSGFEFHWLSVHEVPPCSRIIPDNWSPGQPVPALENGRLVYKMFFYGRDGSRKDGFTFYRAMAQATFDGDGKVSGCRLTRQEKIPIPKEAPLDMTQDEQYRVERGLYPLIERLGSAYASGTEPDARTKKDIAELSTTYKPWFLKGHEEDYRALSPDFWKWIEKNGGKAP